MRWCKSHAGKHLDKPTSPNIVDMGEHDKDKEDEEEKNDNEAEDSKDDHDNNGDEEEVDKQGEWAVNDDGEDHYKNTETQKLPACVMPTAVRNKKFVPVGLRKPPPPSSTEKKDDLVHGSVLVSTCSIRKGESNSYANHAVVDVGKNMFIEDKPTENLLNSMLVPIMQKVVNKKISQHEIPPRRNQTGFPCWVCFLSNWFKDP